MKNWSAYQTAALNAAESGKGNFIVIAGAGSGKTTTGVEMVKRVKGSHIYLAFNRPIADELVTRGVNGRTFHSLTYGIMLRAKGARGVNKFKLREIADQTWPLETLKLYGAFAVKLVSLAKNAGIGALVDDTEQAWDDLVSKHDLELEHEAGDYATAIKIARELLRLSNASNELDFDDMLYLAVKDGVVLPKFDNVFVDEAQDTNAIQRAILRKIMHTESRLFAIGDRAQAIYGFRGADSDSMDLIKSEFGATELPLTISYRCGSKIVEYASKFGIIEAAPGAHEGAVDVVDNLADVLLLAQPRDLVVSRTTKPLVELAYSFLKAQKPAYVMGREIGDGLVKLVEKMNARGVDALIVKLNEYTVREVEKAIAKKEEAKAESIQDKTDCVLFLIDALKETDRTVPALIRTIEALFTDKSQAVILATIHKSKGLEADRVFWINHDYVSKWARQPWQIQQEVNLQYVAATRAKRQLILVPSNK